MVQLSILWMCPAKSYNQDHTMHNKAEHMNAVVPDTDLIKAVKEGYSLWRARMMAGHSRHCSRQLFLIRNWF